MGHLELRVGECHFFVTFENFLKKAAQEGQAVQIGGELMGKCG
jgi:hypothetical protein